MEREREKKKIWLERNYFSFIKVFRDFKRSSEGIYKV
jgi:hypothetical protein